MKEPTFLTVTRVIFPSGVVHYLDKDGKVVATKNSHEKGYTRVCEKRVKPPYLTLSPCPYCGTFQDRGHDALSHVNPSLGVISRSR